MLISGVRQYTFVTLILSGMFLKNLQKYGNPEGALFCFLNREKKKKITIKTTLVT